MTKTSPSPLAQSSDHDLLIGLMAAVQNNHATLLDKFINLQEDMLEIKSGANTTLTDHEARMRTIERKFDEEDYRQLQATVRRNDQWINDHQVRGKFVMAAISGGGAIVGTAITIASYYLSLARK